MTTYRVSVHENQILVETTNDVELGDFSPHTTHEFSGNLSRADFWRVFEQVERQPDCSMIVVHWKDGYQALTKDGD